jgi:hypothetical protein
VSQPTLASSARTLRTIRRTPLHAPLLLPALRACRRPATAAPSVRTLRTTPVAAIHTTPATTMPTITAPSLAGGAKYRELYPIQEPFDSGYFDTGDGHEV